MPSIGVIGTAGRDKTMPLTRELWLAMTEDLRSRVVLEDVLVSGGAAWADHLAVHAFLSGWVSGLRLYLPAPLQDGRFQGPFKSAGSTAGYYHKLFSNVVGFDSQAQIVEAIGKGAEVFSEPVDGGVRSMYARNSKIALHSDALLAYTFSRGDAPEDGGTENTWSKAPTPYKLHVSLWSLVCETQQQSLDYRPADR